jgi:hypothetical protein
MMAWGRKRFDGGILNSSRIVPQNLPISGHGGDAFLRMENTLARIGSYTNSFQEKS